MVTPLFVHAYGWWHACVNGVAAVIFCPLAERLYGKKLVALYFIPGVLGQIFGYLWSPDTAGSSLGIAGVIGALFVFAFLHRREISRLAQLFAICGIGGAIVLCLWRDIHGPPTVLGVLLGGLMMTLSRGTEQRSTANAPVSAVKTAEPERQKETTL